MLKIISSQTQVKEYNGFNILVIDVQFLFDLQVAMTSKSLCGETAAISGAICVKCGKQFKNMSNLNFHIKSVHEIEKVNCDKCFKEFQNPLKLAAHIKQIHTAKDVPEICDQCSKSFKSKREIYHHKKAVHTNEIIKCYHCGLDCKNEYAHRKHIRKCFKNKADTARPLLSCNICLQTFSRQHDLNNHVGTDHDQEPTKNEQDTTNHNMFYNEKDDTNKITVPLEINKEEVDICDEEPNINKQNIDYQKQSILDNEEEDVVKINYLFEIGTKEEKIENKSSIFVEELSKTEKKEEIKEEIVSSAMKVEINGKAYICEICAKSLKSKRNLSVHIKSVHSDEGKITVPCEICSKTYSSNSIRQHFINFHRKSENYQCDVCAKEFSNSKYLSNHKIMVHTTGIFSCENCGNIFSNQHYLRRHMVTVHADAKEECACDICNKTFRNKRFLAHHKKAVHMLQTVKCVSCGKVYKNEYLLRKHSNKYHKL